jgi:hypothetical protein
LPTQLPPNDVDTMTSSLRLFADVLKKSIWMT